MSTPSVMETPVIETTNLCKTYGRTHAVRNLNLTVKSHGITAFLGVNGAGKSTTIKMLLGMIKPTEGSGKVLGHRIDDPVASVDLRRKVACVSEDKRLYGHMTVEQMIRFTSGFYPDWRPEVAGTLMRQFALPPGRKVRDLSKGMRTMLALLLAVSRRPALLILDEPSEGLDPRGVEQLLECLVVQCASGTSIFFSSHQIAEVERISDQICVIHQGRLVLDAPLEEIRQSWRHIDLVFPSIPDESYFQLAGVKRICTRERQMSIFAGGNVEAIVERARGLQASTVDVTPVSLREIFLEAVEKT